MHFLCFMSDVNVLRKLFEKRGITFNSSLISASVESISDYLLHAYWLNYFLHAKGVPKAIENMWKFVVFIALYLILRFARSSAYHHAHTIDTYDNLCYENFRECVCVCVCSNKDDNSQPTFTFGTLSSISLIGL